MPERDVTQQIQNLSTRKRELFESLLKEKQAGKGREADESDAVALVPDLARRDEPFPLTDMQYAYWIGRNGSFQMGNVATHMYEEVELATLDSERLNRSWQRLVERHDMLRAIILPDGRQQILPSVSTYQIEIADLRGKQPDEVEAILQETRVRMSHQVLPTDQWPLFEIRGSLLPNEAIRVHVSIDGLLLDGWSYQLLFREWFALYQDPERELAALDISFRDYVLAEHAAHSTPEYQRALEYWRERLKTLPPAPELPLAQDPATLRQPHFVRRKGRIETTTWQALKSKVAQFGLTPPGLLLAVYTEVIATWSKAARFTLNVPRFNRLPLHPQVNDLLGEFASFTLLEVDYTQPLSFVERARKLQQQLWRDLDHQQVSGVQVLRELSQIQYKGAPVAMPVVFTNLPHEVDRRKDDSNFAMTDRVVYGITQTSQVWLDYQGSEEAGALVFNWDAVEDLFPAGLLDDMFGAFCQLLQELATSTMAWQQAHPLLLPQWQQELFQQVNATEVPATAAYEGLLQTRFARQVSQHAQKPAVITPARTLTYAELDQLANRLGHYLRQQGVRPNQVVAVVMEKGWEQIVAVLGILNAGAAYLPIDPAMPAQRLGYILEHSAATIVLTQSWLEQDIAWPASIQAVSLDQLDLSQLDSHALEPAQTPDDLAYVIYTSGSTGLPKGVMTAQRGVVNAIAYTNERFAVTADDRVLALTALHHDMSVYDIFGLLSAGGTIILPSAGPLNPVEWLQLLQSERITIWNSVPAMLEMLADFAVGAGQSLGETLRLAFLGGDWIPLLLVQRVKALAELVQIVSVGGPTETTLWNIAYPITTVDPDWRSVPYGKPIANTRYYILNEQQQDCPVWVAGELCCAGVGLTKGYWGDEAKTAASFIAHPRTGERLYRTGDLGRYLPDGSIEFIGRKDFQTKINGMRIELGEIEAVLSQHPAVRTAVVTAVEREQTKQLVAHVVVDAPEQTQDTNEFFTDITSQQADTLILDKEKRVQFKLRQYGLRTPGTDQEIIRLKERDHDAERLERYGQRRSYRMFAREPIALDALSEFLSCLSQAALPSLPIPKYLYPSGGGLYPVQVYLYVKPGRVEGLSGGTYYYHPQLHGLVSLNQEAALSADIHIASNQAIFQESAFSLFLIAEMKAIEPMYGSLACDFCLLEAGYMGQLLMSAAPEQQLGLCPLGSVDVNALRSSFLLDESHLLLHSFLGGGITPAQMTLAGYLEEINQISTKAAASSSQESAADRTSKELRSFLQQKLPAYMLPSVIRVVEQLPLTANGKVDRSALSSPALLHNALEARTYVPPTTELERTILRIWQDVLQVEYISIYDNFTEVGGNSLHIVQIHQKLQEALEQEIVVVELFQYPTIAALAEALGAAPRQETTSVTGVVRAEARRSSRRRGRTHNE